jgi:hypothetical protein
MIRTLAVDCASILHCSQDARKTAAETATNEMVIRALRAICKFFLSVRQQNHSDLSLTALDNAFKQFYKKNGGFRDQKMLKSAKAKVDELLAREFHHVQEQKIQKIHAAMKVSCTGLRRLLPQNEGNFRCALIEPNKWQPYGQMLIGRGQLSHWSTISIRCHLLNTTISRNYSNIMSDNDGRKL